MSDIESSESQSSSKRYVVVAVVIAVIVVAAAIGVWVLSRPAGAPDAANRPPAKEQPRPEPPAVAEPAPEPATPAPEASAPRRAKPKPAPEPAAPTPAPTTGTLTVESDVAGAMVFLDREFKGTAPVAIEGVAPGSHRLNLSAEGYEAYSDTVDVAAGPHTVVIRFKDVKLDEAIKVVHKHTVGSCEGQLLADPQGLRYETPNKNDAFVAKFATLEAFEIDYLKKNLRIKLRGGRTYNFTGESADTLFVFHKNVQNARARLAKGDAPAPSRPK
jgi:hypothetical protein